MQKRTTNLPQKSKERGVTFLLATVSLMLFIPMIGLAVDVGFSVFD